MLKYLYLTLITAKSISISKVKNTAQRLSELLQNACRGKGPIWKNIYKWEQQKKPWKYNREDCIVSLTWEWPSSATQLCMTTTRISCWNEMHFMLWRFTVTACTRFFFTKKSKGGLQKWQSLIGLTFGRWSESITSVFIQGIIRWQDFGLFWSPT